MEQVLYIEDPQDKDWEFVIKAYITKRFYDMPSDDAYQQVEIEFNLE